MLLGGIAWCASAVRAVQHELLAPLGSASRQCSTGDSLVPCEQSLSVKYINLERRIDRQEYMDTMLRKFANNSSMIASASRSPGNLVNCTSRNTSCAIATPQFSKLSNADLEALERHPDSYSRDQRVPQTSRQGMMGCYASHVSTLARFGESGTTDFLLILEDDVSLPANFFSEVIPAALEVVANDTAGRPWHAVRFGIPDWGSGTRKFEDDRVTSSEYPTLGVYRALEPPNRTIDARCYMAAPAVLAQRRTVSVLIQHILSRGLIDVDIAYKQIRANSNGSYLTYAVDVPTTQLPTFRSDHTLGPEVLSSRGASRTT